MNTPEFEEKAKFNFKKKVVYDIDWPVTYVTDLKEIYYRTGKTGTRIKDGCPSAEYETGGYSERHRLWLDLDGTVKFD